MSSTKVTQKVIIDVDPGSDDAWALHLLISSEETYDTQILGITCTIGNSTLDYTTRNVLMILESLNRTDIPVYVGADEPIVKKGPLNISFHGRDGFGDLDDYGIKANCDLLKDEHAVNAMRRLILENPNELIIFSVGPETNLALCLKMYPEVRDKIKQIIIMGGNYQGVGNVTYAAEFNFYIDPEAVDIVLKLAKCPIKIVPWEACLKSTLDLPLEWRFNLQSTEKYKKFLTLLNLIEKNSYKDYLNWISCDVLAVAIFLRPESILSSNYYQAKIELIGEHSRGQLVINHEAKECNKNILIIENISTEIFKDLITKSLNN